LRVVAVEQLGEQGVELCSFSGVEALEELVLDGVGVQLQFVEMLLAGDGEGDDVATPVRGVGLPVDIVAGLKAIEDGVDVVAVEIEPTAEFSLAEGAILLQCRQDSEVGAATGWHTRCVESRAKRRNLAGLPRGEPA
jgi:hypothetical protein